MGKKIKEYLEKCTLVVGISNVNSTGLTDIHQTVFSHRKNVPKAKIVGDLTEFYSKQQNILDIWHGLSQCEQDIIECFLRYEGNEFIPAMTKIANKCGFQLKFKDKWDRDRNFFQENRYKNLRFLHLLKKEIPDTKATLLFPGGNDLPFFIGEALKPFVKPLVFDITEYSKEDKDQIICREHRLRDFSSLVHFIAGEKLKVNKNTYDPSNVKLAKIVEAIGFDEVFDNDGKFGTAKGVSRPSDFKIATPLFALAFEAGLVNVDKDMNVSPGKEASDILELSIADLATWLFSVYQEKNSIYELQYIPYVTAYGGNWGIAWHECRKPIFELLKKFPIGQFICFADFADYMKLFNEKFFRSLTNCAITVNGRGYRNYSPEWSECEAHIIEVVFGFLSVIGMIDLAYREGVTRFVFADDTRVGIVGFRITSLGAWILGIGEYVPIEEKTVHTGGGVVVQPDYSIIITGLECRIKHEVNFSRYMTKVSVDENAAVYKLDFQSVVRAHEIGVLPQQIINDLQEASGQSLPDNVTRSLHGWGEKVGRVKIRTITVIETDDPLLLAEIAHIKSIKNMMLSQPQHIIEIPSAQQKQAKTAIEKNGWLVQK